MKNRSEKFGQESKRERKKRAMLGVGEWGSEERKRRKRKRNDLAGGKEDEKEWCRGKEKYLISLKPVEILENLSFLHRNF